MRFFIPTLAAAITILSVVSAIPVPLDNSALQDDVAKPDAAPPSAQGLKNPISDLDLTTFEQMLASTVPNLLNGGTTRLKPDPELNAPGAPPAGDSSM